LVISDLRISGLNGLELLKKVKRLNPKVRALSNLSSQLGYIIRDGSDATSKLYGLDENIDKLERDVRKIRKKLESGQMS
jgi:ribosome-associated translation inhibitor RaiA